MHMLNTHTYRLSVAIACSLLVASCSQLRETGTVLADNNGAMVDADLRYLGQKKYRLRVAGSALVQDGRARQIYQQRMQDIANSYGCKGTKLHDFKAGTENTLLGAREWAEGVFECLQ